MERRERESKVLKVKLICSNKKNGYKYAPVTHDFLFYEVN